MSIGVGTPLVSRAAGPPKGYLTLIFLCTMLAVAFNVVGLESFYQALVVLITGLTVLGALQLARRGGLSYVFGVALIALPFFLALSFLTNMFVSGNHLYLVFLVAFVGAMAMHDRSLRSRLLAATNLWYLVYLAGSLLVYFGVIDLGRSLNIFDSQDRVPWVQVRTLVGLYGSTAHIDSISLFVALLNAAFGRGRARWPMVLLGVAASVMSFRFTPFVALAVAMVAVAMLRVARASPQLARITSTVMALSIALSAYLVVGLDRTVQNPHLSATLNRVTNGRLRIWDEMLERFSGEATVFEQLFGTADTEALYVVGGWPRIQPQTGAVEVFRTANPHNSFLAFALSFGLVPFVFLLAVIGAWARRFVSGRAALLFFYVLAVGITNAELLTFHFPVYVAWVVALADRPTAAVDHRHATDTRSARGTSRMAV